MTDVRVTTAAGADTVISKTTIQEFRASLRGEMLGSNDSDYESARKVFNGMIDRRPALIVRCAGVADVISAVRFARDYQLLVSVRGGGHSGPGFAVCEGGLMIDLSRMKSVRVDPAGQTGPTVRAEGGVTWGDFDFETQAFGLATTGGTARTTGIAGLTLGGGHGFLMRKYGLACDNLLSADLVTAEGRLLTTSNTEHPELFWGLRGGGGNFGVITSFKYRLHSVGPLLGGLLVYPIAKAKEMLRVYREVTSTSPDDLGTLLALATLPDGTPAVALLLGYSGPIGEGERVIHPLRTFGPPLMDQIGPIPYTALQSIVENFNPTGMRNYWKSSYLMALSDDAIDAAVDFFATVPAPHSHMIIEHLGGAVSRIGEKESAVAYRDAPYNALIVGMWTDAAEDEKNIAWVRAMWELLHPFSTGGVYVNYLGEEGQNRIMAAYGREKYERLVALKNTYDPTNLFRLNQNIQPTV